VSDTSPAELAATLARVVAVQDIQQLAYRYALAFDSRDLELLHALWYEDVERLPYPDINIHTVREDFDQWLYGLGPSVLTVGNHVIDLHDGDHATGSVYCLVQMEMGDSYVEQSILYQDRYVRDRGRWLFEVRRHLLWFGTSSPDSPFAQEPANWPERTFGRGTLPEDFPSYRRLRERQ
jgi:SnoaL-like domain